MVIYEEYKVGTRFIQTNQKENCLFAELVGETQNLAIKKKKFNRVMTLS